MTENRPEMPTAGELWRHCKGTLYEIQGLANHSETQEQLVLYRESGLASAVVWARPLAMFMDRHTSGAWRFERQPHVLPEAMPFETRCGEFALPPDPVLETLRGMEGEATNDDRTPSLTR